MAHVPYLCLPGGSHVTIETLMIDIDNSMICVFYVNSSLTEVNCNKLSYNQIQLSPWVLNL